MTELFEKSIRVLELPQLLERLSQKAVSEAAKERALRLTPSTDADDVRRLQDETDAARALIGLRGSPSFSGVKDVREALARAERGGMLNPRELLTIAGLLTNSRRVREYYEADQGEGVKFPRWTRLWLKYGIPALIVVIFVLGYAPKVAIWLGLA